MLRRFALIVMLVAGLGSSAGCAAIQRASKSPGPVEGVVGTGAVNSNVALNGDGRFEAFASTSVNLVPGDTNGAADVFVRDREFGITERVSLGSGQAQANGDSIKPALSGNGRYVAFISTASNLVAGDTNGVADVFVRDTQLDVTTRVNVDSFGNQADSGSITTSISDDGREVAFVTNATNLAPGDTNGFPDVFVHDRQTGATTRESLTTVGGQSAGGANPDAVISGDGNVVAFSSASDDLLGVNGDNNAVTDVFVRNRATATTSRVSVGGGGVEADSASTMPALSETGRYVAFMSSATNLVGGDTNNAEDVFVRDRTGGTTSRTSVATGGAQGNGPSSAPVISDDGRNVAFKSFATNLVGGDTNAVNDIFLRDRTAATTVRASVRTGGAQAGGGQSMNAAISDDGAVVGFISGKTNLVPADTNAADDVFAHLAASVTTERVSVASDEANASSNDPATSGTGRYTAFDSAATNLVPRDTNNASDVFVRDNQTGAIERVSVTSAGLQANRASQRPAISADGRYIVFESAASNLVAGDTNNVIDIFWHDRLTGTTERVSVGDTENQSGSSSSLPDVSDIGRFVVFATSFPLNAGDNNVATDIYMRDRSTNSTILVSKDTANAPANGSSAQPVISGSGEFVAFQSIASDLVANDTNGVSDVFRREIATNTTRRASVDTFSTEGNGASLDAAISADGDVVAFSSAASNLIGNDTNNHGDVFTHRFSCTGICFPPTTRVDVSTAGAQAALGATEPSISSDGRFVAFSSPSNDLVPNDANGVTDVFVRDRTTNRTARASTKLLLQEATGAHDPVMSGDGRTVAFASSARDLVDGDTGLAADIFVRAQPVPTVMTVSPNAHADDGVAFPMTITGTNFLPGVQVRFSNSGVTAAVNTVSDTTITATVTITGGTAPGPVDVYVANTGTGPGSLFGTLAKCAGCLAVT